MMRFIDEHDIGIAQRAAKVLGRVALFLQVCVVEAEQVHAAAVQVGQVLADHRLPHVLPRGLRREEHDVLFLLPHKALDEHEADERRAQADAIAQERAAVEARDADEVFVGILLIPGVQNAGNAGSAGAPENAVKRGAIEHLTIGEGRREPPHGRHGSRRHGSIHPRSERAKATPEVAEYRVQFSDAL